MLTNVLQTQTCTQTVTVATVNQHALWASLLTPLTEHVNLTVCLCSNITTDVWLYVLTATMLTLQETVLYRQNAILTHMLITGQQNVSVLAQVALLLILTQDSVLQFVQMGGMETLTHALRPA